MTPLAPPQVGPPVQPAPDGPRAQTPATAEDRTLFEQIVDELITSQLLLADDWHGLVDDRRDWALAAADQNELIDRLAECRLLTEYQAARVKAGTVYGLVLGNYRVLERVGAGGMGIVFKAEHVLLRRVVALKVLPLSRDQDPRMLRRFRAEMRTVAALRHPNIVAATDAGQVQPAEPNLPVLHYLVMEFVQGSDLEEIVARDGPLEPAFACELAHQVACALSEAHDRHLVHRDVKPSNILVDSQDQAKLLDFGLARDFGTRITDPGSLLGTLDFMAPEQTQDPSGVDIRADIYGLGATLYWCLTGRVPFMPQSTLSQQIASRLREAPPSARARRPGVPPELDAVIAKMMAVRPEDRYQTPREVMRALTPFLPSASASSPGAAARLAEPDGSLGVAGSGERRLSSLRVIAPRGRESRQSQQALVQGLAALYLYRTGRPFVDLLRLQQYARALAEEAMADPAFAGIIGPAFIQALEQTVPLYDIGQLALPDEILHKSGVLDPEGRIVMQSHTTLGAELLERVAGAMGEDGDFLATAVELARHHHEQYDGRGYPDRLAGEAIPLSARVMSLIDSYEAMRSRRSYQPTLPHEAACELILEASPEKYDPRLLEVFRRCADRFDEIHRRVQE